MSEITSKNSEAIFLGYIMIWKKTAHKKRAMAFAWPAFTEAAGALGAA